MQVLKFTTKERAQTGHPIQEFISLLVIYDEQCYAQLQVVLFNQCLNLFEL